MSVPACLLLLAAYGPSSSRAGSAPLPDIVANDNRTPAGEMRDGVLRVDLVAATGNWYPERDQGPAHEVHVFGEEGGPLRNPGPLLRVPAGTEIRATIRNAIAGESLTVHGFHDRPGTPRSVTIASGAVASVVFRASAPGTYHYWGTTRNARLLRDRWGKDTQLIGGIIVDSAAAPPDERVFIIGVEDDSGGSLPSRAIRAVAINGLSWPHAGTFDIAEGDTVRTRWINVSGRSHPMHLHGFYFRVESRGDMSADTIYDSTQTRMVVTELMLPGQTMAGSWVAERPGSWLMHCHMTEHMSPRSHAGPGRTADGGHTHAVHAMAGLVVGWHVSPRQGTGSPPAAAGPAPGARTLRLLVQASPRRYGDNAALGFVIDSGNGEVRRDSVVVPGPALVLQRGTPVEITVVNHIDDPTSIHWHGIELESYFDGVSGWSGAEGRRAPHIAPGDSFVARFTPPRAGTFIYHTHFAEEHQLTSGMYGAMIVLEPGTVHDPIRDRTFVFAQRGPGRSIVAGMTLNGETHPRFTLGMGERHRLRFININPNMPLTIALLADSVPVRWRAIAKDGADLPARMAVGRPASFRMGVGETYDFEFIPDRAGRLTLRALNAEGAVTVSSAIEVR